MKKEQAENHHQSREALTINSKEHGHSVHAFFIGSYHYFNYLTAPVELMSIFTDTLTEDLASSSPQLLSTFL